MWVPSHSEAEVLQKEQARGGEPGQRGSRRKPSRPYKGSALIPATSRTCPRLEAVATHTAQDASCCKADLIDQVLGNAGRFSLAR